MNELREMLRKRQDNIDKMRDILEKAEGEKRDLMPAEEREYKALEREVRLLDLDIGDKKADLGAAGVTHFPGDGPITGPMLLEGGTSDNGSEICMLRPDEKLADYVRARTPEDVLEGPLSTGRFLKGIITGDWKGADAERRAYLELGTDSLGGYLVPHPLSARIIDLARNRSVVMRAGAVTIPMESADLDIAKILGDPTAYWRAEHEAITSSDMEFGKVTLKAKTLAALVKCSVEVIEDAMNLQQVVEQALSQALALELDRACLFGSGVEPEPLGLYNTEGVQVIDMGENGGPLTAYNLFSQATGKVAEANGPEARELACIMAPREYATIDAWVDDVGQPLKPTKSFEDMRKLVSNQVPTDMTKGTASNASCIICGDFSQMLVGTRTNLVLEASRQAADATGSAFSNLQVWIRAYLRADLVIARPPWFVAIDGIIPAA